MNVIQNEKYVLTQINIECLHDLPIDRFPCVSPPTKYYNMHYKYGEIKILPNTKDNNQLQSISKTAYHINWARLLETGAQRWIRFSKYVTLVCKLKEVIVYCFVVRKNLSHLFKIHFNFPEIFISKTCVKQGNSEIQKLGLRYGFDSPNL